MEWVETTGRSVDEAKEAALDELGVDEHDAEFEVVAEARLGLFGRLRSEARVRARVRPTAPRAKEDRRRRRRKAGPDPDGASSDKAGPDGGAGSTHTGTTKTASAKAANAKAGNGEAAGAGAGAKAAEPSEREPTVRAAGGRRSRARGAASAAQDTKADEGATPAGSTRARSNRRHSAATSNEEAPAAPARAPHPEEDEHVEVALEEQAKVAEGFLRGLVNEMGIAAQVSVEQEGQESIQLSLEGSDLGVLIGPKGATLLALQDLTRTVVQRKTGASNGRLWVDVSGYRQKRAAALARFAQQVANEVLATGTRKAMEPMNAADRKVVHDTINTIPGVATLSEGEDLERRVVVYATTDGDPA